MTESIPANDRWSMATWTAIATVIVVAALTATATIRSQTARELTVQSNQQIERATAVLNDLIDMETGQRGFLLTNEERYLEPYHGGLARLKTDLANLHASMSRDTLHAAWEHLIDDVATRRIAVIDSTIAFAQAQRREDAVAIVRSDRGKAMMDSLRDILAQLTRAEREKQQRHASDEDRWAVAVRVVLAIGTVLTLGVLFFLRRSLAAYDAAQRAAAREMERQLAELEEQSRALMDREQGGTTA